MEHDEEQDNEFDNQIRAHNAKKERLEQEAKALYASNLRRLSFDEIDAEDAAIAWEINRKYLTVSNPADAPAFDLLLKQGSVDMFVESSVKGEFRRITREYLPFPLYDAPPTFDQLLEYACADIGYSEFDMYNIFPTGFLVKNSHIIGFSIRNNMKNKTEIEYLANLCNLLKLQVLDLPGLDITQIPREIDNLTELRYLNLTFNHLLSIPDEIDALQNLKALDLSVNKTLGSLPESFGNLTTLEGLNLENNQITTLPASFGNLRQLKKLNLMWNKLEMLPTSFNQLSNLRFVQLDMNHLESLPDFSSNCPNFEYLTIGGNPLRSLYGIPPKFYFDIYHSGASRDLQLTSTGQFLLEYQKREELEVYYRTPVQELAYKVVRGEKLSPHEEERLLHEATPDIRNLLESHLPRGHPYLVALQDRWQVAVSDTQKIIL